MRNLPSLAGVLLAFGIASAAGAATTAVPSRPDVPWVRAGQGAPNHASGDLGRTDRKFIEAAAQSGLAEVAAGQLALQRSRDPRVREYAQALLKDHQEANAQLQRIGAGKGIALPTQLSRGQQGDLRDLQKSKPAKFDQAFLDRMVRDHQKAIDLFGHEVKGRHQDGDLKNFAQQTLIALERHLSAAEALQKESGHLPG